MTMTTETTPATDKKVQTKRRKNLRKLMDAFGVWPNMDYGYEELTAIVGEADPMDNDVDFVPEVCPQYAYSRYDETYTIINLTDDVNVAITSMIPDGSDTLNIPGVILDLDAVTFDKSGQPKTTNGKPGVIEYRIVALRKETAQALAGIVAPSIEGGDHLDVLDGGQCVNHDGIFADWDALRKVFPITEFREFAQDEDNYSPTFGE